MNTRLPLVCFDFGGTLVDDPFEEITSSTSLRARVASILSKSGLTLSADALIEAWSASNRAHDFPFATHFAQEEVWIGKALDTLGCPPSSQAVPRAAILQEYRDALPDALRQQPQLPILRETLQAIRKRGVVLFVASNDREFATPAMVQWAGFSGIFERIFTSEGLSRSTAGAEKPNGEFFKALLRELGCAAGQIIYVGDSERNDIEPTAALGIRAVRYFNPKSDATKTWLDYATATRAPHSYRAPNELHAVLEQALSDLATSHSES